MILTLRDKVWWFALWSRVFVLFSSAVSNFVLPDHVADAFVAPKPMDDKEQTYGDWIVELLFGGLMRWDAQYFIHIAMYGYTYENCLAFFPLFPLLSRVVAQVLYLFLGGLLSEYSLILLSCVFINIFCFVKSASILYELSLRVLRNERLAYKAAILYCVNPASIFFSAPYSESLFACLTFHGMLKSGCGFKRKFSVNCGIIFGLSAITRSNGILNIGFIAYKCLKDIAHQTILKFSQQLQELNVHVLLMVPAMFMVTSIVTIPYLASVVLSVSPFVTYQIYGYYKYCIPHNHNLPNFLVKFANINDLVVPGDAMLESVSSDHWCKRALPFSYSYVQSHYWNVGFLSYYEWKQIPNFLLALPVIWIIFCESYKYIMKNRWHCLYLGLSNRYIARLSKSGGETENLPDVLPYIIHAAFLTLFSVLCAHIQVTIRLISSSSPMLYWFCAKIISEKESFPERSSKLSNDLLKICKRKSQHGFVQYDTEPVEYMCSYWKVFVLRSLLLNDKAKFTCLFFLSYLLFGTIMFSNFLPWT